MAKQLQGQEDEQGLESCLGKPVVMSARYSDMGSAPKSVAYTKEPNEIKLFRFAWLPRP